MATKKALVIDDSPTILAYHSALLHSFGINVDTACNGMDALEKVLQVEYDLILSDINMPVMDGFEFVKKLRKIEEYTTIPVVFITTLDSQSDRSKSLLAGGNLYIVKPIDMEVLKEILVSIIE
jgi:CheY-like chemotaxis protein